jgi:hypothetical protein
MNEQTNVFRCVHFHKEVRGRLVDTKGGQSQILVGSIKENCLQEDESLGESRVQQALLSLFPLPGTECSHSGE